MQSLLTLDDLVRFCEERNFESFNANDTGYKLCVQVPSVYTFDENQAESSLLMGKVKLLHTGRNRNNSNVTKKAAEKCMDTIQYKPVLANFVELDDGITDFTSHDMIINDDGSTTYLERQVGCFTSDKPYMEYDEETDRYYVYATVAIPREYTNAAEIIERKNGTKVSAELGINKMSYDSKEKVLMLEDIEVMAVTLLGTRPDGTEVQEGMQGARLDIKDFSNVIRYEQNDKLVEVLEKLNTTLSNFNNTDTTRKEENNLVEEMNVEQTEVEEVTEPVVETEDAETTETVTETEATEITTNEEVTEVESDDLPEVVEDFSVKYSVTVGDKVKEFSVSLSEKINAVSTLVNDTYSEADATYYACEVYDDDKYVIMLDCWSGRAFKQSYKVRGDVYSLVGDRVEVYSIYVTEDERKELDKMRSNYSKFEEVSAKLAKYEAEPQKLDVLASAKYSYIKNTAEFAELENDHFDLSVNEVTDKADAILLSYAEKGALTFEADSTENKNVGMKVLSHENKKTSRYGSLFSR